MKKSSRRTIIILIIVAICIYGIQLLIFRNPRDTGFYILQDLAFMPITIAIATIAVGEVINIKDSRDRLHKTRMLTSSFFTEIGAGLMHEMMRHSEYDQGISDLISETHEGDNIDAERISEVVDASGLRVKMSEEFYNRVQQMIKERQMVLTVISSNPLLLEHETFTSMLWSIFHLIDEFRLRGHDFDKLSEADIKHLESDFTVTLKYMLKTWLGNMKYMKETYPGFYNEARNRIEMAHAKDE